MPVTLQLITHHNWRAALQLGVHPDQQRFVADYTPIALVVLAKAYVRPGGLEWRPLAIYADDQIVGLIELACDLQSTSNYWIYHFFIDQRYQGQGYGKAALQLAIDQIKQWFTQCQQINLTVHPDNVRAQQVYVAAGFRPTGDERDGEPVYTVDVGR